LGFTPEEWLADATLWYQRIHPEDRAIALEDEATAKMDGKPLMSEYRLVRRDGQVVWVHDEATLIFDADGHPSHWQGFMIDITERKVTEAALEDSEVRYRG